MYQLARHVLGEQRQEVEQRCGGKTGISADMLKYTQDVHGRALRAFQGADVTLDWLKGLTDGLVNTFDLLNETET